jgi:hypothetical protein
MKIEMKLDDLRKLKIMVCTPMYGGMCFGSFTKSCIDLATLCAKHQIQVQFFFLFNESLITRARAYLCDEFLRSDCTHLMFIDSDIEFQPLDVLALAHLNKDIAGGPYPKKTIAWEKVKRAVESGYAKDNPADLSQFIGDYVFNPEPGATSIQLDEPAPVLEIGTGFMMIRRDVFEKFRPAYPELEITPDHNRTEHFNGSRQINMYFDTQIDPVTNRYLSEDYAFCQRARKIGLKVWLCPWMELKHSGTFIYGGTLAAVAQLGVVDVVVPVSKIPEGAVVEENAVASIPAAPASPANVAGPASPATPLSRQQRRALEREQEKAK